MDRGGCDPRPTTHDGVSEVGKGRMSNKKWRYYPERVDQVFSWADRTRHERIRSTTWESLKNISSVHVHVTYTTLRAEDGGTERLDRSAARELDTGTARCRSGSCCVRGYHVLCTVHRFCVVLQAGLCRIIERILTSGAGGSTSVVLAGAHERAIQGGMVCTSAVLPLIKSKRPGVVGVPRLMLGGKVLRGPVLISTPWTVPRARGHIREPHHLKRSRSL